MTLEDILEEVGGRMEDEYPRLPRLYLKDALAAGGVVLDVQVSFEVPYFYHRGEGFDWVWQRFLVNGVLWRGQIPELPLLQPARAAARPLEIHLDRKYRYSLRGTDTVAGRDCWVVDFEPAAAVEGASLWKGTVWIDRVLYARVKTRALQLGLAGDVISNEQTTLTSRSTRRETPRRGTRRASSCRRGSMPRSCSRS